MHPDYDTPHTGHAPSHEAIARRAYALWQERGCPEGESTADWFAAEAELRLAALESNRDEPRDVDDESPVTLGDPAAARANTPAHAGQLPPPHRR